MADKVKKRKTRYPVIEFDRLQMYFGSPYVIDLEGVEGKVTVYSPTIGKILDIGEQIFYSSLNIFITNTTSYRLPLWEAGQDWNVLSDFELFCMLISNGIDENVSKLLFGDLDWSKFSLFQKNVGDEPKVVLYNQESNIEINEDVYQHIAQYLRNVFNSFPEEKITSDGTMKQWYINSDIRERENVKTKKEKNGESETYSIQPIISACINHPGFKYRLSELRDVGVCEFYDSVKRLQVYESSTALMKGMYSGMISAKDINPNDYNFMRDIN